MCGEHQEYRWVITFRVILWDVIDCLCLTFTGPSYIMVQASLYTEAVGRVTMTCSMAWDIFHITGSVWMESTWNDGEQTVAFPVIWHAITFMWKHSNDGPIS